MLDKSDNSGRKQKLATNLGKNDGHLRSFYNLRNSEEISSENPSQQSLSASDQRLDKHDRFLHPVSLHEFFEASKSLLGADKAGTQESVKHRESKPYSTILQQLLDRRPRVLWSGIPATTGFLKDSWSYKDLLANTVKQGSVANLLNQSRLLRLLQFAVNAGERKTETIVESDSKDLQEETHEFDVVGGSSTVASIKEYWQKLTGHDHLLRLLQFAMNAGERKTETIVEGDSKDLQEETHEFDVVYIGGGSSTVMSILATPKEYWQEVTGKKEPRIVVIDGGDELWQKMRPNWRMGQPAYLLALLGEKAPYVAGQFMRAGDYAAKLKSVKTGLSVFLCEAYSVEEDGDNKWCIRAKDKNSKNLTFYTDISVLANGPGGAREQKEIPLEVDPEFPEIETPHPKETTGRAYLQADQISSGLTKVFEGSGATAIWCMQVAHGQNIIDGCTKEARIIWISREKGPKFPNAFPPGGRNDNFEEIPVEHYTATRLKRRIIRGDKIHLWYEGEDGTEFCIVADQRIESLGSDPEAPFGAWDILSEKIRSKLTPIYDNEEYFYDEPTKTILGVTVSDPHRKLFIIGPAAYSALNVQGKETQRKYAQADGTLPAGVRADKNIVKPGDYRKYAQAGETLPAGCRAFEGIVLLKAIEAARTNYMPLAYRESGDIDYNTDRRTPVAIDVAKKHLYLPPSTANEFVRRIMSERTSPKAPFGLEPEAIRGIERDMAVAEFPKIMERISGSLPFWVKEPEESQELSSTMASQPFSSYWTESQLFKDTTSSPTRDLGNYSTQRDLLHRLKEWLNDLERWLDHFGPSTEPISYIASLKIASENTSRYEEQSTESQVTEKPPSRLEMIVQLQNERQRRIPEIGNDLNAIGKYLVKDLKHKRLQAEMNPLVDKHKNLIADFVACYKQFVENELVLPAIKKHYEEDIVPKTYQDLLKRTQGEEEYEEEEQGDGHIVEFPEEAEERKFRCLVAVMERLMGLNNKGFEVNEKGEMTLPEAFEVNEVGGTKYSEITLPKAFKVNEEGKITLSEAFEVNEKGKITLSEAFEVNEKGKITLSEAFEVNKKGKITLSEAFEANENGEIALFKGFEEFRADARLDAINLSKEFKVDAKTRKVTLPKRIEVDEGSEITLSEAFEVNEEGKITLSKAFKVNEGGKITLFKGFEVDAGTREVTLPKGIEVNEKGEVTLSEAFEVNEEGKITLSKAFEVDAKTREFTLPKGFEVNEKGEVTLSEAFEVNEEGKITLSKAFEVDAKTREFTLPKGFEVNEKGEVTLSEAFEVNEEGKITLSKAFEMDWQDKITLSKAFEMDRQGKITLFKAFKVDAKTREVTLPKRIEVDTRTREVTLPKEFKVDAKTREITLPKGIEVNEKGEVILPGGFTVLRNKIVLPQGFRVNGETRKIILPEGCEVNREGARITALSEGLNAETIKKCIGNFFKLLAKKETYMQVEVEIPLQSPGKTDHPKSNFKQTFTHELYHGLKIKEERVLKDSLQQIEILKADIDRAFNDETLNEMPFPSENLLDTLQGNKFIERAKKVIIGSEGRDTLDNDVKVSLGVLGRYKGNWDSSLPLTKKDFCVLLLVRTMDGYMGQIHSGMQTQEFLKLLGFPERKVKILLALMDEDYVYQHLTNYFPVGGRTGALLAQHNELACQFDKDEKPKPLPSPEEAKGLTKKLAKSLVDKAYELGISAHAFYELVKLYDRCGLDGNIDFLKQDLYYLIKIVKDPSSGEETVVGYSKEAKSAISQLDGYVERKAQRRQQRIHYLRMRELFPSLPQDTPLFL